MKNLNYGITGEDLYDLFGRYGSIRQMRLGNATNTKGTAFVVFEDVMDVRVNGIFIFEQLLTTIVPAGKECIGPLEWFPSSRTLHRR